MSPAPRSPFTARRGIAATAVVALVLGVLALAPPPPASAATIDAVGSAGQIYVTGLGSGASVQLFHNGNDVTTTLIGRTWYPGQKPDGVNGHVATLVADTDEAVAGQGHALVIREVPPGDYQVHVGADVSNTVTVTDDTPDPAFSAPADTTYQTTQLSDCPAVPAANSQCYTYIPTRDGTLLSANITFPKTAMPVGGWPVLVDYSGYDPSTPGQTPQEAAMFPYQGYVVVGLNMRGTGCSGGAFDYFEALQSLDGYDAIEVLAHQPWVAHVAAGEVRSVPDESGLVGKAKIGMVGISYMGISQLFVGQTQPPDLLAITPLSTIADTYRSTLRPGGIFNDGFALSWAQDRVDSAKPAAHQWVKDRISGGDTTCASNQRLRLQSVDLLNKNDTNPYYQATGGDELSPRTFVHNIDVPTYLGGAWQDEQTGGQFSSMINDFDPALRAKGQVKAFLTNGVHTESLATQDLGRLMAFVDFYVKRATPRIDPTLNFGIGSVLQGLFGGTRLDLAYNPWAAPTYDSTYAGWVKAVTVLEGQPAIHVVWENGAGQVNPANPTTIPGTPLGTTASDFTSWPPSEITPQRYYLQPDGKLALTAPSVADDQARGESSYVYDPSTKRASTFDGGTDQIWTAETQTTPDSDPGGIHWKPLAEGNSLSFVTDAFTKTTAMAGQGSVDLWLRSNAADTDLEVTITEIRPDGQERYIQSGWLRASHRALDNAESTVLAPFQTQLQADAAPLPAGQFVPVRVGLFPFAHLFRTGSKLRLNIEAPGGNQPFWKYDSCTLTHVVAGCATVAGVGPQINEIAHSLGRPSSVVLPVLPDNKRPTIPAYAQASTPCPSVRNEPCRPYLPARVSTGVTATVDSTGTAHVSWTLPTTGPAPDGFVVTPSTGLAVAGFGPQTSADLLIPHGVPVTFTVQEVYSGVNGPPSDASLSVIDDGTRLVPMTPTRLLDTRPGSGHQVFPTMAGGTSRDLPLDGVSTAAEAVVLNVTVTGPTAGGFLTAYPTGETRPISSNLNFVPGQTVANLVTVKVGAGHSVSLFNSFGSTDVVVDVVGYYSGEHAPVAATYTAQAPTARARLPSRPRPPGVRHPGVRREGHPRGAGWGHRRPGRGHRGGAQPDGHRSHRRWLRDRLPDGPGGQPAAAGLVHQLRARRHRGQPRDRVGRRRQLDHVVQPLRQHRPGGRRGRLLPAWRCLGWRLPPVEPHPRARHPARFRPPGLPPARLGAAPGPPGRQRHHRAGRRRRGAGQPDRHRPHRVGLPGRVPHGGGPQQPAAGVQPQLHARAHRAQPHRDQDRVERQDLAGQLVRLHRRHRGPGRLVRLTPPDGRGRRPPPPCGR